MEDDYYKLNFSEKQALKDLEGMLSYTFKNEQVFMWGKPVTMTKTSEEEETRDVILLKFLKEKEFRVQDAYNMIIRCLSWRKEFGADSIVEQDLGFEELEGAVSYIGGCDREGHPVYYTDYHELIKNKQMYDNIFGVEENVQKFIKWKVQLLERSMKMLDFKPEGVNSIVIAYDFEDAFPDELLDAGEQICQILLNNYPGIISYRISLNLPWYLRLLVLICIQCGLTATDTPMGKLVIAKQGRAFETLYKYIKPEYIPIKYGGLSRRGELNKRHVSEITVKGGERVDIPIVGIKAHSKIKWDVMVGGWDLEYSAKFIPDAVASLAVMVEKPRKMKATDLAVRSSCIAHEAGKLVLSINNTASSEYKIVAYRHLVKNYSMF